MTRVVIVLIILSLGLAACSGPATEEPLPDALAVLTQAAAAIRATDTFRMTVERTGAPYFIITELGDAEFRRAEVQYSAPNTIQARVRVAALEIPLDLDFYFEAANQWLRGIWTNNNWVPISFAPGFTPAALMADDTGFQAAIGSLTDLEMVGRETLVDGTPVYHIKAQAEGAAVSAFMAGLIEVTGDVLADVYVHRETNQPVRFVIVQTDSATEDSPEPTTWTIEVYDFNEPVELDVPTAAAEATPEATPAS